MKMMSQDELVLWEKIETFQIDESPNVVLDFQTRLARENGWSLTYSARAIREYRRFLFLCLRAGHLVTPSEEVDQVWHLHLVYTRSYWDRLCGGVLGKPLHHHPTTGGLAEGGKFRDGYQKTLASYQHFFGESPPEDIWPPVERRFSHRDCQWIDVSRNWILPRPGFLDRLTRPLFQVRNWSLTAPVLLAALTLTGCVSVLDYKGESFLALYLALLPAALLLSWVLGRVMRAEGAFQDRTAAQDPYALAFLGGGQTRQFQAILAKLYGEKLIDLSSANYSEPKIRRFSDHPESGRALSTLEAKVLSTIPKNRFAPISQIKQSLAPVFQAEKEKLIIAGWLLSPSARFQLGFWYALPVLSLIALGVAKVSVGLDRDKPVGFLIALLILSFILMVIRLCFVARRTRGGERIWKELYAAEAAGMWSKIGSQPREEMVPMLPLAIALLGPAALAQAGDFQDLDHALKYGAANGGNSGSSGCGSGCGGGSGGGDGGGCGGCGGGGGGGGD